MYNYKITCARTLVGFFRHVTTSCTCILIFITSCEKRGEGENEYARILLFLREKPFVIRGKAVI